MVNENHILVAGFAQFPKNTPVFETQKLMCCVFIIDKETEIIQNASFTFVMGITSDFVSSLVIGKSIKNGVDEIISIIEKRFFAPGQRAVIQSVIDAYDRYRQECK